MSCKWVVLSGSGDRVEITDRLEDYERKRCSGMGVNGWPGEGINLGGRKWSGGE